MAFSFNWENRVDGQDYVMADDVNNLALGISELGDYADTHISNLSNPHGVTKTQLDLGNVDNTADVDKPISTAQQAAIDAMGALKIDKTAIVNDLTTGGADKVLSAEQGKILQASKADQPYQQHTQTDGSWSVTDSAGGLVKEASISGNTVQNGTPTPEAPVTPLCLKAGDKIKVVEENLLDLSRCTFERCINNGDGALTSNIVNSTYCNVRLPNEYNSYVFRNGVSVSFSVLSVPIDARIQIVVYGNRTDGSTYQVFSSAVGINTVTAKPSMFVSMDSIDLRFNVKSTAFTDTTTVFNNFMLSYDANAPYEPYTLHQTLTVPCDLWKWDKWNVLTGDVVTRSVVIPSYNGETITGEYVSSTGGLDVDAYVVYDSGVETVTHYAGQPITLPQGVVNMLVESENGVLPSEVNMLYRQDLKAYIESIINGIMDTMSTHITGLTVRVSELETAGGDLT